MATLLEELYGEPGPPPEISPRTPYPDETPAQTDTRNAATQRMRASDLKSRGIPSYRDDNGDVRAVEDETGAALTAFDKRHGIAYDSSGQAKSVNYGESGAPTLSDPFAELPSQTDEKGNIYKQGRGLYQWVGTDPDVAAKSQQDEHDKEISKQSALLNRKLSLDEHDLTAGTRQQKAMKTDLLSSVPTLQDPKYHGADLETVKKGIDEHFDAQYAAPEANATRGWFSKDLSPEAAATRATIDQSKADAHAKAEQYFALNDRLGELHQSVSDNRTRERAMVETMLAHSEGKKGPLDEPPPAEYAPVDKWTETLPADPQEAPQHVVNAVKDGAVPAVAAPAAAAAAHEAADAQNKADGLKESNPTLAQQFEAVAKGILQGVGNGVAELVKSPIGQGVIAAAGVTTPGILFNPLTGEWHSPEERATQYAKAISDANPKLDERLQGTVGAKIGNFAGGVLPYVAATIASGPAAPAVDAALFFSSGYQSTYDDAKAHGAGEDKAHVAGLVNGSINALLAMPLRTVGKAYEALFGDTTPKVIATAIRNAYEHGGPEATGSLLGDLAERIKAGGEGAEAMRQEAVEGINSLRDEILKTPAQRLADVAKTAAAHAAVGGAVQTAQNIVSQSYDPERGTFENVPEQAIGFGALGAISKGFEQVAAGIKAKRALDIIAKGGNEPPEALPGPEGKPTPPAPTGGEPSETNDRRIDVQKQPAGGEPAKAGASAAEPPDKGGAAAEPQRTDAAGAKSADEGAAARPVSGDVEKAPVAAGDTIISNGRRYTVGDLTDEHVELRPEDKPNAAPLTVPHEQVVERLANKTWQHVKAETITDAFSQMGGGVTDGLYKSLFTKLQSGDMTEGGKPSRILAELKPQFDAGTIKSIDDVRSAVARVQAAPAQKSIDTAAHEAATSPQNGLPEPTQPQKEAGNYQKGHVVVGGLDVSIENPAGSRRQPEFKPLESHYGYIKGTVGADKDHVDVFIKPNTPTDYSGPVFVVNQHDASGKFDEHKAVIGVNTPQDALAEYKSNYEAGWTGGRNVVRFDNPQEFKKWATSGAAGKPAIDTHVPAQLATVAQKLGLTYTGDTRSGQTQFADTGGAKSTTFQVSQNATPAQLGEKVSEVRRRMSGSQVAGTSLPLEQTYSAGHGPLAEVQNLVRGAMNSRKASLEAVGHAPAVHETHGDVTTEIGIGVSDGKILVDHDKLAAATKDFTPRERSRTIRRAIDEEIVHVAAVKWERAHPDNRAKIEAWGKEDDEIGRALASSYSGWDKLNDRQKGHEKVRAVIQKRWTGRVTETARAVLSAVVKALRDVWDKLTSEQRGIVEGIESVLKGEDKPATPQIPPQGGKYVLPSFVTAGQKPTKLQARASELTARLDALAGSKAHSGGSITDTTIRTLLRSPSGKALDQAEKKIVKLEEQHAAKTGQQQSSEGGELPRVPTRTDVPANTPEVRQGDGEQTTGGSGAVERGETPAQQSRAGQPEKASTLDAETQQAVRDAFDDLAAAKPRTEEKVSPKQRAIYLAVVRGGDVEKVARDYAMQPKHVEAIYDATLRKHGILGAGRPTDQVGIPVEKMPAFMKLASTLVSKGVDTPQKLATELDALVPGKGRKYSQALWDAIGMVKPELRQTVDWSAQYGPPSAVAEFSALPTGKSREGSSASFADIEPLNDAASEIAAIAADQKETKAAERLANAPDTSPAKLKVQKEFLLGALDKAITAAPSELPEGYHKLLETYQEAEKKSAKFVESRDAQHERDQAARAFRNGVPHIEIEVPGDGTFTIVNSKDALQTFRDSAKKRFPTVVAKPDSLGGNLRATESKVTPLGKPKGAGDLIKIAAIATSKDETRKVIMNVLSDGKQLVANDGRRLLMVDGKSGGTAKSPIHFDPATLKPVKEPETYPNYRQIIPRADEQHEVATIDTAALQKLLSQALEMTSEQSKSVGLWLDADGKVGVTSSTPEVGEFSGGSDPNTSKFLASYDPHFLMDGMKAARAMGQEKLKLSLDKTAPAISPAVLTAKGMTYVVMPMRMAETAETSDGKHPLAEQPAKVEEAAVAEPETNTSSPAESEVLGASNPQIHTPVFKEWFGDSKVVDDKGEPLVVYSGHSNAELYGDHYNPKSGTAGGFYATEDPKIASKYAMGKVGVKEYYENGDQYRFQLKNGKWNKKLWQMELTPEQVQKTRDFFKDEERGSVYDIERYWKDNAPYDADARRGMYRGLTDLHSIWKFLEAMGDNIAYNKENNEEGTIPITERQRKNTFEQLLDHLGIRWQSKDWIQPGVLPVYLRIRNPLDADKPFPPDLLEALKQRAKGEHTVTETEMLDAHWTRDYPLKRWIQDIESGDEYWTTQVPSKAIPILKQFGYDGIKERGLKGAETPREQRSINWIAFDPGQIKSAIANKGTFDPSNDSMLAAGLPFKAVVEKMTPGLDVGRDIKEGVQSLLLPSAMSPEHLKAAELVGSKLGAMHRRQEASAALLEKDWKAFERMGVHRDDISLVKNPGIQFMSDISMGKPPATATLRATAERIRQQFQSRVALLEKADAPLEAVRENYFPGMWTLESRRAFNQAMGEAVEHGRVDETFDASKASAARDWIRDRAGEIMDEGGGSDKDALSYVTKRPLKGRESFRKAKVFDDIMTGVQLGLQPISNNPIDLVKLKLAEMDRSIMANEVFQELKAKDQLKTISPFTRVPDGWEKVNDRYGTVYGPPDMASPEKEPASPGMMEAKTASTYIGLPILGYRIVPSHTADILNNYLSSSLYNNRYFGTLYKGWMGLANALNQTQLGVGSAFHAGFTTMEAQISGGANIVKDVYGLLRGNRSVTDLLKTSRNFAAASVETGLTGDKVLNAWRNPEGPMSPRIAQVVRAAELAGGGFTLETGLKTDQSSKALSDWLNGHRMRAAARSPVAFIEMMARPIMNGLVPRQKAGVFAHMVWRIIEQNPGKSLDDLRGEFRSAWNRVDARLGQVRYDRLFMNNVAKNVVQGAIRAPGWSGGTIAELGGAFKDTYKFFESSAKAGKLPADIPDRVAYTISLLVTVAVVNGLLTYLFTGEHPKDLDYWAFRTGGKDSHGNPERFVLPTYAKDILAYIKEPITTLINKLHPMLSVVGDLFKNKDYYGVQIRDTDANQLMQLEQSGVYVAKSFTPFWIRGAKKTVDQGGDTAKALLPLVGVMPAPAKLSQSPAMALASSINAGKMGVAPLTERQQERRLEKSNISSAIRRGAPVDITGALHRGNLKPSDIAPLYKRATLPPLAAAVDHMSVEEVQRVYAKASPEEKRQLAPVLTRKTAAQSRRLGAGMFGGF